MEEGESGLIMGRTDVEKGVEGGCVLCDCGATLTVEKVHYSETLSERHVMRQDP